MSDTPKLTNQCHVMSSYPSLQSEKLKKIFIKLVLLYEFNVQLKSPHFHYDITFYTVSRGLYSFNPV